jgi:hypothetical protein
MRLFHGKLAKLQLAVLQARAQRRRGGPREPAAQIHGDMKRAAKASRAANDSHSQRYWSGEVTRKSNALDLEPRIFTANSPRKIALSLKHSAEVSKRRKGTSFQSAMSMLNFYINRAGQGLAAPRKRTLQRARGELRKAFGHA